VDFVIDEYAINFRENILNVENIFAVNDVLNGSNRQCYRVLPQIRHAQHEGVFTPCREYVPGTLHARYVDVRLILETDDPLIVPFVRAFTWTVDVPDLVQQVTQVRVPIDGIRINYPKRFHAKPNVQVSWLDAQHEDRYALTESDLFGFRLQMINRSTPVERVANILAQGY
jgi:hypothetical protein